MPRRAQQEGRTDAGPLVTLRVRSYVSVNVLENGSVLLGSDVEAPATPRSKLAMLTRRALLAA